MDPEKSKLYLTSALKKGVETGHLKMAKESGKGSNSYKIGDAAKEDDKAKKAAAKKASVTKAKKAKGSQEKPKKGATPKKSAASRVKDADKPKKTPIKKIGKKAAAKTDKPKK